MRATPSEVLTAVGDPYNLPKLWKYLKEVKVESTTSYVVKFKVFMSFTFRMTVTAMKDTVVHEGTMERPAAYFKFTVRSYKASPVFARVIAEGDYMGPLESLARGPMRKFLLHFRSSLVDLMAGGPSQAASVEPDRPGRGLEVVPAIPEARAMVVAGLQGSLMNGPERNVHVSSLRQIKASRAGRRKSVRPNRERPERSDEDATVAALTSAEGEAYGATLGHGDHKESRDWSQTR
ncbi:MAG: hypothetical protein ACP5HQ_03055 [Thermoprotei archaeon]